MSDVIYTFGIPTYRRNKNVFTLLKKIQTINFKESWDVIIIDDGGIPNEDLELEVLRFQKLYNINLIVHSQNKGYSETFFEIIKHAKGRYLIMLEDDGDIDVPNINFLLESKTYPKVDIIISDFIDNTQTISRTIRSYFQGADIQNFHALTSHAPGIIYNTTTIRALIETTQNLKEVCPTLVQVYPQVLIYLLGHLEDPQFSCIGFPKTIASMAIDQVDSQLMDITGNHYYSPKSRLQQQLEWLGLIKYLETKYSNEKFTKLKNQIYKNHISNHIDTLKRFDRDLFSNSVLGLLKYIIKWYFLKLIKRIN